MDFGYILTSTEGRIPRSQWWAGVVILVVISIILGVLVSFIFGGPFTLVGGIATLILQLILAYPYYAVSAKRFQDRDKPGTLALILIAIGILQTILTLIGVMGNPLSQNALDWIFSIILLIVGIWFLVELGILKGTAGPNTYGPDPLEGRS